MSLPLSSCVNHFLQAAPSAPLAPENAPLIGKTWHARIDSDENRCLSQG